MNDRFQNALQELTADLETYLGGRLSHSEFHRHLDSYFDAYSATAVWQHSPYLPGEEAFWCAIWTAQHLADDEHWQDGCTQRELGFLLPFLRDRSALPAPYSGRRPHEPNVA